METDRVSADQLIQKLRAANAEQVRLDDALKAVRAHMRDVVAELEQLRPGERPTWAAIAKAVGMSPAQLKFLQLADRAESMQKRREARGEVRERPGLTVTAVADRLGVQRPTVYRWLSNGRLTPVRDDAGHVYVLDDELLKNASK